MASAFQLAVSLLILFSVDATHFRGGTIQWKPINSTAVEIFHRVSWRRTWENYADCNSTYEPLLGSPSETLECRSGDCSSGVVIGTMQFYCTDFHVREDWVTGTRSYQYSFSGENPIFEASFRSCCWISTLAIGADGNWQVRVAGNLAVRPDTMEINSSPVTSSTPILRLQHGCNHVYQIPVEDPDGDIVRCRWAVGEAECYDVCNAFPNATLDQNTCTLTYNAIGPVGVYAVAIQIEDYATASSTVPMSSIPLQFLVNVTASNLSCFDRPVLVRPSPVAGSCIPVPLNSTYTAQLVAHSEDRIGSFETVSPRGLMVDQQVEQSADNSSIYSVDVAWTPTLSQFGLNIFCFAAEAVSRLVSDQSCITFVVGISGPRVLSSSVFPTGSFLPTNDTVWQMEFDQPVSKPRNIYSIRIFEDGNPTAIEEIKSDSEFVTFPESGSNGTRVTFKVQSNSFMANKNYHVFVDAGFAVGEQFCNQISEAISYANFWTFSVPTITVTPRFANSLGGTPIELQLPGVDWKSSDRIECEFEGAPGSQSAVVLSCSKALCVSPFLQITHGSIQLKVTVNVENKYETRLLVISPEQGHSVSVEGKDETPLINLNDQVNITWNPSALVPEGLLGPATVKISYVVLSYSGNTFEKDTQITLKQNTENDGQESVVITSPSTFLVCNNYENNGFYTICPVHVMVSLSSNQLPSDISLWSGVFFVTNSDTSISSITVGSIVDQCTKWYNNNQLPAQLSRLPKCPPNVLIASFDFDFIRESLTSIIASEDIYHNTFMRYFHPNISQCYRQRSPNNDFGQQCCYGENGILVKDGKGGGSTDINSPLNNYYYHILRDLLPYILCCENSMNVGCDKYFERRPSGDESGYMFSKPASSAGDPHLVTSDGLKYTFNGKGEFTLVQSDNQELTVQGRMEQVEDNKGTLAPGTVFTAIVAKQFSPEATVQFEVDKSDGYLRTLVNTEQVSFDDINTLEFEGVSLLDKGSGTVLAVFSSGSYVQVTVSNRIINILMVGLPETLKRRTSGLMGTFNDIMSDDLMPRGSNQAIPTDSSIESIHNNFGITWIIANPSESLFSYRQGEGHGTFYFPNFTPMFEATFTNTTLEDEAKKICGEDVSCLFDVAATGRLEIGMATMNAVEMVNTIENVTKPIVCEPPCSQGVCAEDNMCSCNSGYDGDRCEMQVIEECPQNPCLNGGTCSQIGFTLTCTCSPDYTGILCQDRVPPFSITVINGSPIVSGNQVLVYFSTSKPATVYCILDGVRTNCSNGFIRYTDIPQGTHLLRIVASTDRKEKATVHRSIYIGSCAIYFINNGVSVTNGVATIEFSGSPDVTSFMCRVDRAELSPCRSPHRYQNLSSGQHKVVIRPANCNRKEGRQSDTFFV